MPLETILLVDDEPDIRKIGVMSLSVVGKWKVAQAASCDEALEIATRERPDLVILDVMMPGTDGPATFAKLRARAETAAIPVIFMTAKVQTHEIDEYLKLGAIGVIRKPFDPMRLSEEVRRIYDRAPVVEGTSPRQ